MPITALATNEVVSSSNLNGATVGNLAAEDAAWAVATANNVNTAVRVGLQNLPSGQRPRAGANVQRILFQVRKTSSNSGNPAALVRIALVGGPALLSSGITAASSTVGETNQFFFDWQVLLDGGAEPDGSNVEVLVEISSAGGGPNARNAGDIGYVAWQADHEDIPDAPLPTITGTGAATLAPLSGSGQASLQLEGGKNATLQPLLGSGAGSLSISGTGAGVLAPLLGTGTGELVSQDPITGSGNAALQPLLGSGAASLSLLGAGTATLQPLTGTGSGGLSIQAIGAGTLQPLTGTGFAELGNFSGVYGTLNKTLQPLLGSGSGQLSIQAIGATNLQPLLGSGAGSLTLIATGSTYLGPLTGTGNGVSILEAVGIGSLQPVLGTGEGHLESLPIYGTLNGSFIPLQGLATGFIGSSLAVPADRVGLAKQGAKKDDRISGTSGDAKAIGRISAVTEESRVAADKAGARVA
jgi:hypothetical protein